MAEHKAKHEEAKGGPFTAAQIAAALSISKRSVLRRLRGVTPAGAAIVYGQQASAWTVQSLPSEYRNRLERTASRQGYRDIEHMLSSPPTPWTPEVPLSEAQRSHVNKAAKLRKALQPSLARLNDLKMTGADLVRLGIEDFRRVFGYGITARHWRRLVKRTVERDRGAENWSRLELYLDENTARRASASRKSNALSDAALQDIDELIASFGDPVNPTREEKALLWAYAFEAFEGGADGRQDQRHGKNALLQYLARRAPFLAKSESALRAAFNRKHRQWLKLGRRFEALLDKRAESSGNFRAPEFSEEEVHRLLARTLECGGRIAQAYREMMAAFEFSADVMAYYGPGQGRKSDVPKRLLDRVRYDLPLLMDHHHGPNCANHHGPHIPRDWSGVHSGDWFSGDDSTMPVVWYEEDAPREPIRGQFLAMIDVRSLFILCWVLIADKSYNSRDILTLITKVHDNWGLPREGWHFERGAWKARLLTGEKLAGFDNVPWPDAETGLRKFGLRFIHAKRAESKVVENVLGRLQTYMERCMGYVGRDERHDRYERTQKHIQKVRSGRVHASEVFLSRDEWTTELEQIVATYNHETQEGKMLQGRSPWQAYQDFYGDTPLRRLSPQSRYLLATYRKRVRVGDNGISFTVGKERFTYMNENTGQLRGRHVVAWFNPEQPDLLSVTVPDFDEFMPFTVERTVEPPAFDPGSDLLETAHRQNAAHRAYGKRLYRTVRKDFPEDFQRRMLVEEVVDPQREELGERMLQQQAAASEGRDKHNAKIASAEQETRSRGLPLSPQQERRRDQRESARDLASFLSDE